MGRIGGKDNVTDRRNLTGRVGPFGSLVSVFLHAEAPSHMDIG